VAFAGAKYQSAGKTGTAQVYSLRGAKAREVAKNLRDHALYIGFAPVDHPQIAIAVIVEHGTWGASVAAPIVRKMFDYWLVDRPKALAARELKNPSPLAEAGAGHPGAGLPGAGHPGAEPGVPMPAPADPKPSGGGPVPTAPARTQLTRGGAQ
jgi:penicillin-binding protein 2